VVRRALPGATVRVSLDRHHFYWTQGCLHSLPFFDFPVHGAVRPFSWSQDRLPAPDAAAHNRGCTQLPSFTFSSDTTAPAPFHHVWPLGTVRLGRCLVFGHQLDAHASAAATLVTCGHPACWTGTVRHCHSFLPTFPSWFVLLFCTVLFVQLTAVQLLYWIGFLHSRVCAVLGPPFTLNLPEPVPRRAHSSFWTQTCTPTTLRFPFDSPFVFMASSFFARLPELQTATAAFLLPPRGGFHSTAPVGTIHTFLCHSRGWALDWFRYLGYWTLAWTRVTKGPLDRTLYTCCRTVAPLDWTYLRWFVVFTTHQILCRYSLRTRSSTGSLPHDSFLRTAHFAQGWTPRWFACGFHDVSLRLSGPLPPAGGHHHTFLLRTRVHRSCAAHCWTFTCLTPFIPFTLLFYLDTRATPG